MTETRMNTNGGLEGERKQERAQQSEWFSEDVDQLGSGAAPTVKDGVCVCECVFGDGWYLCILVFACAVVSSGPQQLPVLTKGN